MVLTRVRSGLTSTVIYSVHMSERIIPMFIAVPTTYQSPMCCQLKFGIDKQSLLQIHEFSLSMVKSHLFVIPHYLLRFHDNTDNTRVAGAGLSSVRTQGCTAAVFCDFLGIGAKPGNYRWDKTGHCMHAWSCAMSHIL